MVNIVKHFSGREALQKINGLETVIRPDFIFCKVVWGCFYVHFPSPCSLFGGVDGWLARMVTNTTDLVNFVKFCVYREFKRFFSVSVFRAGRERILDRFRAEFVNIKKGRSSLIFTFLESI